MRVISDIDKFSKSSKRAVSTIGVYDGLHVAHMEIIRKVVEEARGFNGESVLITFDTHPQKIIDNLPGSFLGMLTTPDEKIEILKDTGVDFLIFLKTTEALLNTSAEDFISEILVKKIGVTKVITGYDFHFGRGRRGNPELLVSKGREFGFDVEIFQPIKVDSEVVSSSLIRELLSNGEIRKANRLLGRYYGVGGQVVRGTGRGRGLGFPTANLRVEYPNKLIPLRGVYFSEVKSVDFSGFGMCNIGVRPTFAESNFEIEVHIIDFPDREIYGENVKIGLIDRIRAEKRFETIEELKQQIEIDRKICIEKM